MRTFPLKKLALVCFSACMFTMCSPLRNEASPDEREVSATGLDGRNFYAPVFDDVTRQRLDSNLQQAIVKFEEDPTEENYVWLGRREAYLYNFKRAIEIFSEGLKQYPESYTLLRHRGHRYLSVRAFDKALSDLTRAAELAPDEPVATELPGEPNRLNFPIFSTQFNIWYHLGIAHYLTGDFSKARETFERCLEFSTNDDLKCATIDWLYMTLRRMGLKEEATSLLTQISPAMTIIENDSYHKRLMMYKGFFNPNSLLKVNEPTGDVELMLATQGYGVGNWYLYEGDSSRAIDIFQQVVKGQHFSAFGFIAAEVELNKR